MKKLAFLILLFLQSSLLHAITADELVAIHKVTTTEMHDISAPQSGSLVYNTTENSLYFYTGTVWKRMRSTGTETMINAGNGTVVTGNGTSTSKYEIGI